MPGAPEGADLTSSAEREQSSPRPAAAPALPHPDEGGGMSEPCRRCPQPQGFRLYRQREPKTRHETAVRHHRAAPDRRVADRKVRSLASRSRLIGTGSPSSPGFTYSGRELS